MTEPFQKQYSSPLRIVELLKLRGLSIEDDNLGVAALKRIGYYRLSAYLYPFIETPKEQQLFKRGSTLESALTLYDFDQNLRIMIFGEIARIEVAVRSALANIVSKETGNVFWITESSSYANKEQFYKTMQVIDKELMRTKEIFIAHFRHKYIDPYPPAWMLVEVLPLGTINSILGSLANNKLRKEIAAEFSLPAPVFKSWLTVIALTRNACCHHARIWNKENAISPVVPRSLQRPWLGSNVRPDRIFYNISIIKWFANVLTPGNDLSRRLRNLLSDYPTVDINSMGFPADWQNEPIWQS